jgi:hypothetical protein
MRKMVNDDNDGQLLTGHFGTGKLIKGVSIEDMLYIISYTCYWLSQQCHNPNLLNQMIFFQFLVLNATFSNMSAISWRPVLVVEEAGIPGKNHRPWASNS